MAMAMAKTKAAPAVPENAFAGKPKPPTDKELTEALGPAKPLWDRLLKELGDELKLPKREWGTHSVKAGWSLRVKQADRIILYLAPFKGRFRASFALGDKAAHAALASGLPKPVINLIKCAKKYAEGTAVRIDVLGREEIVVVKKLAEAKIRN